MMNKDKTGDRLIASIRKSKTDSVASKTATPAKNKPGAADPTPETTPPAPTAGAAKKRETDSSLSQDNYSIGRRVWPD